MLVHMIYVLSVAALTLSLPPSAYSHQAQGVVFLIGLIGVWRYGWGLVHFVRGLYFLRVAFPRIRKRARRAVAKAGYGHAFLLVTSFRIDAPTTMRVYRAVFEAALAAPAGATVVASIVEVGDERLIRRLHSRVCGDRVRLRIVRIPGTGKRDALTQGFKAIASFGPGPNDTAAVVDGDSIVPRDLIEKCASIFVLDERIGALTTDETCIVEGAKIFRDWYSLRFAQRQVLMCSMGLSGRVLTLTGRMSMFRARLVADPEFYDDLNTDSFDHWRLGRIKMLTGDDKTSWYWMLKRGWKMSYVPDVEVETIEQPPHESFLLSARVLMIRWFGNMLRTNRRALALGPWRTGLFPWWAILDQRISMWTCLSGLVIAILGTLFVNPFVMVLYLLWIATSRYVVSLSFLAFGREMRISYPFLLYFNQIFGSMVKTYIFSRLDRQRWTRQATTLAQRSDRWEIAYRRISSRFMHAGAVLSFVALIAWISGTLSPVDNRLDRVRMIAARAPIEALDSASAGMATRTSPGIAASAASLSTASSGAEALANTTTGVAR